MEHTKITYKPCTLKELAVLYHVSIKTMRKWLGCDSLKNIVPERGYYYSIRQVKLIMEHLGEP
jgi:hypothetical protein